MRKQLQLGEFEEIILLTVGILDGNAYGVSIRDEIENRLGRQVSVGALQTTLRRLEKKGFLESQHGESSESRRGRPKLFFSLTPLGKRSLEYVRGTRNDLWNALPQSIVNLS